MFGVIIIALSTPEAAWSRTIDDLSGLAWTHPWAALAMGLCLFSLAGVPPMAGFYGKLWIFNAALAVADGPDARGFQFLAIVGVLNAAVGAYYYLRILMKMTFSPAPAVPLRPRAAWPTTLAVGACASLSLFVPLFAAPLFHAARESAEAAVSIPEVGPIEPTEVLRIRTAARAKIGD